MTLHSASGSFSVPSGSTSAIPVTGLGATPQWMRFWCCFVNGTGTTTTLKVSRGMTDGTRHFTTCVATTEGSSTIVRQMTRTDSVIVQITAGGALEGYLTLTSFDADGFTVTPTDALTATVTVHWEAFWGHSGVYLDNRQLNTATGNWSSTAPGFQPDAILSMVVQSTVLNSAQTGSFLSEGFVAGSNQGGTSVRIETGSTANYTWDIVSTSSIAFRLSGSSGGAIDRELRFVSFDINGYTMNQITGTTAHYAAFMCLKGGLYALVTNSAQASTGTFDTTVTGITPTSVLGMSAVERTATMTTGGEGANVAYGSITESGQQGMLIHEFNNETLSGSQTSESYSRSTTAAFLEHYVRTGADTLSVQGVITSSAFLASTVRLNQTDGDSTAGLLLLFVMGDSPTGGGDLVVDQFRRIADLSYGVHVKHKTRGLRSGLSYAQVPIGAAAIVAQRVKPHAHMLNRRELAAITPHGRPSQLDVLGIIPVYGVPAGPGPGPGSGVVFELILRRRIVRR